MSKSLVLGNGNILLCFDKCGQLRDFYYYHIGLENHVGHGCVHRIGVFVDGFFSWLDDSSWNINVDYFHGTMGSSISAINHERGIKLLFSDVVDNEHSVFLRNVSIKNLFSYQRQCKLFFHQQFRIYDTSRRDTAYFDPDRNIIVHYEGRRNFVVGGQSDEKSFDDYSIGNYGIEGKEGTWRDAEDGILEKNAIEHGSVDSVIAFTDLLEENGEKKIDYWITAEKSLEKAIKLHEYVIQKSPVHIQEHTRAFWNKWVEKPDINFADLESSIVDFYKKSLLVIQTHIGKKGEIIASGDSDMFQYGKDTYAYVWPRDAAFTTIAFIKAGYSRNTRNFFDFCSQVISDEGYFYHKYRSDKSIGSSWHPWVFEEKKRLPIQEDETALILYALWQYYETSRDLEFVKSVYEKLIKKAADFMCAYRDEKSGLPKGSFDLWEQDFSSSTFTSSSVYGGLLAAGKFAELFGKENDAERYFSAAKEIQKSLVKKLYNNKSGFFDRALEKRKGKIIRDVRIDMSSFYGIFYFGILGAKHKYLKNSFETVKDVLTNKNEIGGVIRYVGDKFHRANDYSFSNPWFITTLWRAQYEIAIAKNKKDLKETKEFLYWVIKYAMPSGILSEQILADSGKQISAAPLVWSHAEFVSTVMDYVKKYEQLEK